MKFSPTPLPGLIIVELEPNRDERGFFARVWCRRELEARGLEGRFVQCNLSQSERRGTLRGLHYQLEPHTEAKLVRCIEGRIFDVAVDLRQDSPTFQQWFGMELSAENRTMLFIPKGLAHGYLTLSDHALCMYESSAFYEPNAERGIRWNDPTFSIAWPMTPTVVSPKDQGYPNFRLL